MELSTIDRALLSRVGDGLPLVQRPYAVLARMIGLTEAEALARLGALTRTGAIKRLGLIVRHHELGYRANAMIAWDLAQDRVDPIGERMALYPFVTLCYRRRRYPPQWPYNLFAMIHGRERATVERQVELLCRELAIADAPHVVLFSRRRFIQRGARYAAPAQGAQSEFRHG